MSDSPNLVLPRSALDVLMATLNVDVIGLIECLVSPGWRLSFGSADAPAIHYNLSGTGRMVVLICGYFRATYGTSIDLFAGLSTPIVERFEPGDELGSKLQAALAEISSRQV